MFDENAGKHEFKVELDAVYAAKLQVLLEMGKQKATNAPISANDMISKALAQGIDSMLRHVLGMGMPLPYGEGHMQSTMARAGVVDLLAE